MKNTVLQRISTLAETDRAAAAADLRRALAAAGGPLLEAGGEPDDSIGVTFVATGFANPPALRCPLLPGLEASVPMQQLAGFYDVWWYEVVARKDICTNYQFRTGC